VLDSPKHGGDLGPEEEVEPQIIVQSIRETIAPKLIKSDVEIMKIYRSRISFPGVDYVPASLEKLQEAIHSIAKERHLVVNETWMTKDPSTFPDTRYSSWCDDGWKLWFWKICGLEASFASSYSKSKA
jgi:hypothetical protein